MQNDILEVRLDVEVSWPKGRKLLKCNAKMYDPLKCMAKMYDPLKCIAKMYDPLKCIAEMYDPLGLVAPVILLGKIFL